MASKRPTLLEPGSLRLADGEEEAKGTPIGYIVAWLRKRMPEFGGHTATAADRILIVRAETGSGKSTVLPVAVFRILRAATTPERMRYRGPGVVCTQPRVLTAMALAADVDRAHSPWNPDMILGETVGYQTGPVSDKPASGLIFATAGVLAAQLRRQEDAEIMGRYRFIIVDEAHERSLDGDMLLMLLRNFYERNLGNEKLPFLLLASATIVPKRYADYFGVGAANTVEVVGRQYPIVTVWPETGTNDYPRAAAETAARIHAAGIDDPPDQSDIMIFVPGAAEATAISRLLTSMNTSKAPMLILSINREVVISRAGDYVLLFAPPDTLPWVNGEPPRRRVIIATIVAETGLTVDTLRYVIDGGYTRAREVYAPHGVEGLTTRPAAQSRIHQRRGRAGRLFPGEFHPLYTENVFKALDEHQLPEMILSGPAPVYMAAVREQLRQKERTGDTAPAFRYDDMGLLDLPPAEAFLSANATATALGFVTLKAATIGSTLTRLGEVASAFARASMEGARVLIAGPMWGASASDLVTAVAMFGTNPGSLLTSKERRKGKIAGMAAAQIMFAPYITQMVSGADIAHGGAIVMPPTPEEISLERTKLALTDDFAVCVLMWDSFLDRLDKSQGDVAAVMDWCDAMGVSYDAMVELGRRREELSEEMLVAGLDPHRGVSSRLARAALDQFAARLQALKRCLYEGLRARALRYRPGDADGPPCYETATGVRVKPPAMLAPTRTEPTRLLAPRWIVTDAVVLRQAMGSADEVPQLYTPETNLVSVMDGYVDVDGSFAEPREPNARVR